MRVVKREGQKINSGSTNNEEGYVKKKLSRQKRRKTKISPRGRRGTVDGGEK